MVQISLRRKLAYGQHPFGAPFPKSLILKDPTVQGGSAHSKGVDPDEESPRRIGYLPELALKLSSPRPRLRTSMARRLIFWFSVESGIMNRSAASV